LGKHSGKHSHNPVLDVTDIPCRTESVERVVQEVSKAAKAVCGFEERDGYLRARLQARRGIDGKFTSKKAYKPIQSKA
jgi:hypothetical protein